MHTSKTPSLKPLQEAIQKAPNMAGENSLKETQKCKNLSFCTHSLCLIKPAEPKC